MKKSSQIYDSGIVKSRSQKLTSSLYHLIDSLNKGQLSFNYGGKIVNAVPADAVRVLSEWSQNDSIGHSLRNIIVNAVLSSENKQIGSGIICALALTPQGKSLLSLDETKFRKSSRAEEDDLIAGAKYMIGQGVVSKIVFHALKAGLLSSDDLRFNLTYHQDIIIKQITTKRLLGCIHPVFEKYPKSVEGKLLFVDGFIESLGEIDTLLQECAESKICVVLCADGFSPDVVNTLYQNWLESRLFVFPFHIGNWPDKNILEYAQSVGSRCVSSSTGNILNLTKLHDLGPTLDITFDHNFLNIEDDSGDEFSLEILSPGRFKPIMGLIEDRIRICQLSCRGIAQKGIARSSEYRKIMSDIGFENITISNSAVYCGLMAAKACKKLLNNMGAAIIVE